MEVILLEKIQKLGELGDKVTVRPGYGRNFLIPKHKAVPATAENLARFEEQRADLESVQADAYARADTRAEKLRDMEITITANAGSEGKLFGSVGAGDIADAANASGAEVEKREIRLPEGPLREIGDYDIEVHLNADVTVTIKVKVIPDEGGSAA
ncbi:MAG: 50S ribosomal protein L9 [Gammaproteobacteria bacterium]|nr:50S ribosomal protein L9 [Gammaproteobacteria bacterium]